VKDGGQIQQDGKVGSTRREPNAAACDATSSRSVT
jgi:hypothetical protein